MHKSFLSIAAVLGALSVALGAFAAHGLGIGSRRMRCRFLKPG